MGTIAFQQISPEELAAEKNKSAGKIVYSIKDSGRDYNEDEVFAEDNAKKFPKGKFKRISPIFGTLGYLFRNLSGGKTRNDIVIECFRIAQHTNRSRFIKELIIIYDNLDENSKHRVDIFDWFCRRENISVAKFWGAYQEGAFSYEDALTKSALSASKQDLINVVKTFMSKEKNHNDRKLMAEMTGLTENKPLVSIEDNSQTANVFVGNGNKIPSFMESLRRSENKAPEINEDRLLSEGRTDFIEGELVSKEEKVLVERKHSTGELEL